MQGGIMLCRRTFVASLYAPLIVIFMACGGTAIVSEGRDATRFFRRHANLHREAHSTPELEFGAQPKAEPQMGVWRFPNGSNIFNQVIKTQTKLADLKLSISSQEQRLNENKQKMDHLLKEEPLWKEGLTQISTAEHDGRGFLTKLYDENEALRQKEIALTNNRTAMSMKLVRFQEKFGEQSTQEGLLVKENFELQSNLTRVTLEKQQILDALRGLMHQSPNVELNKE